MTRSNNLPLLIGGCPRSGTTALLQVLNSNPSVFISSEENLVNITQVLGKLLGTRERRGASLHQGMRALSGRETLNNENIHSHNFTREAIWPVVESIYAWHQNQLRADFPLKVWGDKFPNYYKEIDAVLQIPGVRYLHLTRNPLDVINSMIRRTEMAKQGRDWWKAITEFDAMLDAWVEAYRISKRIQDRSNVLILDYEDLVFSFDATIKKINEFLGTDLEFENSLISDPDKHFDRSYLNQAMQSRILAHTDVAQYFAEREGMPISQFESTLQSVRGRPAQMSDPETIRVFVASTPAEWLPMKVLEFSIKETTRKAVIVSALYTYQRSIPVPAKLENRPRTPFSFQRFLIPELCEFSGKAIYLDADMQVFQDINNLWSVDFNGCDLQTVKEGNQGRRGQFSVMLLDCEGLHWNVDQIVANLDEGKLDYSGLMYEMKTAKKIGRDISRHWNSLEEYDGTSTCLLHYTDMNTQPWISTTNPLGYLWVACLRRAIAGGFVTEQDLEREVQSGHIRPSLLVQIRDGVDDPLALSPTVKKLDQNFVAPYKSLKCGKGWPWTTPLSAMKAFLKHHYYHSPLARLFG